MIFLNTKLSVRRTVLTGASIVIFTALVGVVVTGCSKSSSGSDAGGSTGSASSTFDVSNMKSSDIVANVNGENITAADLFDGMTHFVPSHIQNFPQNIQVTQETGRLVLQTLIINKIKIQLAKLLKVPVQQADLDRAYADDKLMQQPRWTVPYETLLAQQGYTQNSYEQEVLAPQIAEINLLQTKVVISNEALQEAYKSTQASYTVPAGVHIRRIVCATQNQAANVMKGLQEGHPMSAYLADNIARDGVGGDLTDDTNLATWIRTDQADPALGKAEQALASAKINDYVGPFPIGPQWWVMQVVDKRPATLLTYDQVQDLVRISYIHQMTQTDGKDWLALQELQGVRTATIHINIPAYQNMALQMHDLSVTSNPPAAGRAPQPKPSSGSASH